MTVTSPTNTATFDGNGVTTVFPFTFRFFADTDLEVVRTLADESTVTLTLGVDYTVQGANDLDGGSITTTGFVLAVDEELTVTRWLSPVQLTDLRNQGKFFAETHESVFDYLTMLIQQYIGAIDFNNRKCLRVPENIPVMASRALRAGSIQGWDENGNPLPVYPQSGSALDLALDLANSSDAAKGAGMIGYRGRTVRDKLDEFSTVDDYKLAGMTDIQAIEAMLADTGGTARLASDRVYELDGWTYSTTTGVVNIIGAGKPSPDAGITTLLEHGASVISGHVEIRAPSVNIRDFGVDCGTARGYPHGTGCITVDAPTGEIGISFTSKNIAIMGADTTDPSTSHGFLVEGFDQNEISDTDCFKLWYGIILKGRRGFVRKTRGWMLSGVGVFVKSDLPASGGFVADATAKEVIVDGWIGTTYAANNTFDGVNVMSSTDIAGSVKVLNVLQTFGNTAVRVVGGGPTLYCAGVEIDGVKAVGTYIGVETFGTTYDVKMDNIDAENPKSGLVIKTSGASTGWQVGRFGGLFTDAAITAAYMADFGGSGSWSEATCRSGIGTKRIPFTPDTVICGKTAGQMIIDGDGDLSLGGSWSGEAGNPPSLKILPGNALHFRGRFVNVVATGTSLAAIPGGVRSGSAPTYITAGKNAASTDISVGIRIGAAGMELVFPNVAGVGVGGFFDIDQIVYSR